MAKNLSKSSPTYMNVIYLIMLHNDGNVDKNFHHSIFYRSQEKQISPKPFQTDRQTDGHYFGKKDYPALMPTSESPYFFFTSPTVFPKNKFGYYYFYNPKSPPVFLFD